MESGRGAGSGDQPAQLRRYVPPHQRKRDDGEAPGVPDAPDQPEEREAAGSSAPWKKRSTDEGQSSHRKPGRAAEATSWWSAKARGSSTDQKHDLPDVRGDGEDVSIGGSTVTAASASSTGSYDPVIPMHAWKIGNIVHAPLHEPAQTPKILPGEPGADRAFLEYSAHDFGDRPGFIKHKKYIYSKWRYFIISGIYQTHAVMLPVYTFATSTLASWKRPEEHISVLDWDEKERRAREGEKPMEAQGAHDAVYARMLPHAASMSEFSVSRLTYPTSRAFKEPARLIGWVHWQSLPHLLKTFRRLSPNFPMDQSFLNAHQCPCAEQIAQAVRDSDSKDGHNYYYGQPRAKSEDDTPPSAWTKPHSLTKSLREGDRSSRGSVSSVREGESDKGTGGGTPRSFIAAALHRWAPSWMANAEDDESAGDDNSTEDDKSAAGEELTDDTEPSVMSGRKKKPPDSVEKPCNSDDFDIHSWAPGNGEVVYNMALGCKEWFETDGFKRGSLTLLEWQDFDSAGPDWFIPLPGRTEAFLPHPGRCKDWAGARAETVFDPRPFLDGSSQIVHGTRDRQLQSGDRGWDHVCGREDEGDDGRKQEGVQTSEGRSGSSTTATKPIAVDARVASDWDEARKELTESAWQGMVLASLHQGNPTEANKLEARAQMIDFLGKLGDKMGWMADNAKVLEPLIQRDFGALVPPLAENAA